MDELPAAAAGDQPDATPERRGLDAWIWVGWGAAILVAYVLSIGPAAVAHRKMPAARPTIEAVYKPVTLLADHCEPAKGCLLWYVTVIWRVD